MSHSVPIDVKGEAGRERRISRLVILASLGLHLVVVALLMFGLPASLPQPQEEEPISVELVPPPEPPKPPPPPEPPPPPKSAQNQPLPVLQPVVQFGEKDSGPRESPEGNSATETQASPAPQRDPDEKERPQPASVTAVKATGEAPRLGAGDAPAPLPEDPQKAQRAAALRKAKTLFSQRASRDSLATMAMRSAPRDVRIARLCATELKEQLIHGTPSYFPEIVPFERLKEGTVVEGLSSAFRSNYEWYHLSYRCEVDAEATKVVSFAFDVGKPLTPDEWARRNLPSQ
jgi:hypothetical protein